MGLACEASPPFNFWLLTLSILMEASLVKDSRKCNCCMLERERERGYLETLVNIDMINIFSQPSRVSLANEFIRKCHICYLI